MITGFADSTTADIFNGVDSKAARKIPKVVWRVAQRKLDLLNAATSLQDLSGVPGNRLENLKGQLAGKYSIRLNDQYRVVFAFVASNAQDVVVTDYH